MASKGFNRVPGQRSKVFSAIVFFLCMLSITFAKELPKLFLLGTMKSGSSSLFEFLVRHPKICAGIRKEINFFQDDTFFSHTIQPNVNKQVRAQFAEFFPDVQCVKKGGMFTDGTPQYHLMAKILPRFREVYTPEEMSKLKFIVSLREPVSRAISYYEMFTMIALADGLKIAEVQTMKERDSIFHPGFDDAESLSLFLKYFRRDQIMVLNAEMMFKQTTTVMGAIAAFLNISYIPVWNGPFPHDDHHQHPRYRNILKCCQNFVPDLDCSFVGPLMDRYTPINNRLYSILNETRPMTFAKEPIFPLFNDTKTRSIACVPDARAILNAKIEKSNKKSCRRGG